MKLNILLGCMLTAANKRTNDSRFLLHYLINTMALQGFKIKDIFVWKVYHPLEWRESSETFISDNLSIMLPLCVSDWHNWKCPIISSHFGSSSFQYWTDLRILTISWPLLSLPWIWGDNPPLIQRNNRKLKR